MFNNSMFTNLPSPIPNPRSSVIMDDDAELRPFLINKKEHVNFYLPPIQHVLSPSSSPSTSEEEDFTPVRKNSIASLLNTEPLLKRGRPRGAGIVKRRRKDSGHDFLPRATKGLRHFSKQVCDKVAQKGNTTYNEVADELALDLQKSSQHKHNYDQKNIRRRVYDALNVLMAMNIITKDKKVIRWLGIPSCYKKRSPDQELLKEIEKEQEKQEEMIRSVEILRRVVNDKLSKHGHIRNIMWRNQQLTVDEENKIALPFFIIQCPATHDIQSNQHSAVISFVNQDQHSIIEDTDVLNTLL